MWYICETTLLCGYVWVTRHETILGRKLVGKSQRDPYLTRCEPRGILGIYHITGILGNENDYLMIYWELVRWWGNSDNFDYCTLEGIFETPSIGVYLRVLKLEGTCQKENTSKNLSLFLQLSFFTVRRIFEGNLSFGTHIQASIES